MIREECQILLESLVGKNLTEKWWNGYNRAFDKTPEEQFKEDPKVVYDYLMHYSYGGW